MSQPALVPFNAQGAIAMPTPPRPPQVPIMDELQWWRDAYEVQARALKLALANYTALLDKLEAEGWTPGTTPSLGAPVAYAVGAVIPAGQYVATVAGSITVTPALGPVFTLPAGTNSAATTISLMPVT